MSNPSEVEALKAAVRGELWTSRKSAHEEYDRALLTLAGGALALSVTLLKDMFPLDKVVKSDWLISSWYLFTLTIFLIISSFLLSQFAHQEALSRLDVEPPLPPQVIIPRIIVAFNWLAGATFFAGVVAMITFSACNFNERLKNAQEDSKRKKVPGNTTYTNTSSASSKTCCCCTSIARNTGRRRAAVRVYSSSKCTPSAQAVIPALAR